MAVPPTDTRPATTAAILAGGRSRRMGTPKAGVLLDGRPLLAHAVEAVRGAGLRPVVVAKRGSVLPELGDLPRWDEPDAPTHPLTGVVAALRRAGRPLVVLPVDLPWVPSGVLAHLAGRPEDLVVVEGAGRLHPLLARVSPVHVEALGRAAAAGARVVTTVEDLGAARAGDDVVARFGPPDRLLRNVNRPDDLANPAWTND